ncbi:AMP-binding protein [Bordetella sp. 15P40C-2]|uniref:AMP-binding protein n=1 Tax=Bordetella sp. 15P40C-2 TaxID=2572246 RepID=UPI001321BD6B|nr:AMP-binding protein [Bordetella sp. 15P40C-2]MVW70595.1 AMP-binding protein [Bordetella sp. 15P40C-2]
MDFYSLLTQHARSAPQRIAFQEKDRAVDYANLLAEVDRLAALLQSHGARRGDRLALWMPNCVEWLTTFLACARLGITVIAVNTRFKEHEVGQLLERGRCKWLACWPGFKSLPFIDILNRVQPAILGQLRGVLVVEGDASVNERLRNVVSGADLIAYGDATNVSSEIAEPGEENDGALVYTTSGTTSAPKLVLHRQKGLTMHGAIAARAYGVDAHSVVLIAAPLCGAFGFSTMLSGLVPGATLVSLAVFDAKTTCRQIIEHGVTHTHANNEWLDLVLKEAPSQTKPFPSLRYVGFASFAPSLDDLPERARAAGIPIAGLYGSSELQALVAGHRLDTEWQHRRIAGGTLASPDGRVRAVDSETGAVLPHGAIGQIEIKAPSLMSEYLDNPEATLKAVRPDGYFCTGDLGYTLDEHSFIFQGRDGEHLRLAGFLVNPMEIESFIRSLEGVQAVQIVGAEQAGKTVPVAFVIRAQNGDVTEQAIIAACASSMAKFKVPVRVVFVDEFPTVQSANSNKVQKHELRHIAQELLDGL